MSLRPRPQAPWTCPTAPKWARMSPRPVCQPSEAETLLFPSPEMDSRGFTGFGAQSTWIPTRVPCFRGSAVDWAHCEMTFKAVRWVRTRCSETGWSREPIAAPRVQEQQAAPAVRAGTQRTWRPRPAAPWKQREPLEGEAALPRRGPSRQLCPTASQPHGASFCSSRI